MKLERKNNYSSKEFICNLTKEFDEASGISDKHHRFFQHYILADEWCRNNKCLAIRVPGGTVGGIWIDDNNVITKIVVDTNYVVKTYPDNVNKLMKKYIGRIVR